MKKLIFRDVMPVISSSESSQMSKLKVIGGVFMGC